MSTLRTDLVLALTRLQRWTYVKRFGQRLGKVTMRHDLLTRSTAGNDELLLLVVSEHPSGQICLNRHTFHAAWEARARGAMKADRIPLTVTLAQDQYQLTVGSSDLKLRLGTVPLIDGDKARGYWPLTVGIL